MGYKSILQNGLEDLKGFFGVSSAAEVEGSMAGSRPLWSSSTLAGVGLILGASFSVVALAGSASAQDAQPKTGGTAVFALEEDPNYLTRDLTTQSETGTIGCILYQGLMGIDAGGVPYPLLAKSVDISDDKLTYTFVLNDANWQDGKPVTAKDVKYTYEEISGKHSPTFMRTLTAIEKIEAVSDKEVAITLKKPYGPFLIALSCQRRAGGERPLYPQGMGAGQPSEAGQEPRLLGRRQALPRRGDRPDRAFRRGAHPGPAVGPDRPHTLVRLTGLGLPAYRAQSAVAPARRPQAAGHGLHFDQYREGAV